MKKVMMIAFAAALFMFMAGETLVAQDQWWIITNREGVQRGAADNKLTLNSGESYIYIYFKEPIDDFDKIQLTFNNDNPVDIYWQAVYCPGQVWGPYMGGQDKPRGVFNITGFTGGAIETDMSQFTYTWTNISRKAFTKSDITGLCLQIRASARTNLQLTDISFK